MAVSSTIRFARRPFVAVSAAAALLVALFTVPYHVPVPPSFSDSYIFGYSNRAGLVIVGLLSLLAAFTLPLPRRIARAGKPLTRSTLLKALAITLALGIPLFLLTYRLDGFIESPYTVDRTRLLLEGHTPYRDFEFCYGLLALYGPAFLVRAFHFTVPAACDFFFLAACLFGVWELYLILIWSEFPSARQREVFLVVFVLFLPALLATTTAYTLPRFLTGGLLAMLSQRLLVRSPIRRNHLLAILLPVPGTALTLLISPEMGLAYAAGITLYLLRFGSLRKPDHLAAYLAMLLGIASILLFAAHRGAFITLSSFSSGAFNFPIVPAPHILVFLVALAVCAAYLAARLRRGENTAFVALGSIAPAMLPAAFGRCDPGHVMFDGMLVLIIALLVCAGSSPIPRLLLPAVLAVFVVIPTVRGFRGLGSTLALVSLPYLLHTQPSHDALVQRLTLRIWGPVKGPVNFRRMQARKTADQPVDLAAFGLPAQTVFAAPFGFMGNHTGVYHTSSIAEGYFLSVVDMVAPRDVARKLGELDLHPERPLLVPENAEFTCTIQPDGARAEIGSLFAYPYRAAAVHAGDVTEPLCAAIRSRYHIAQPATQERFGYALWIPNAAAIP